MPTEYAMFGPADGAAAQRAVGEGCGPGGSEDLLDIRHSCAARSGIDFRGLLHFQFALAAGLFRS